MTELLQITGLSLILGLAATGMVWFVWGIVENVRSMMTRSAADAAHDAASEDMDEPEAETSDVGVHAVIEPEQ